jgi:hypothetical protein
MLNTSVSIPLLPGDKLEYRGPYLRKESVVQIATTVADSYASRVAKDEERAWIERAAFYVYLPIEERLEAND